MKKRKKELAVKGKNNLFRSVLSKIIDVKSIIFPSKMQIHFRGESTVCTAMSRREIRNVAMQICKAAFTAAKYRGY